MKKRRIQKENQKSECLTVPRLSALASWLVYVWRIRVTGSPSYATRSVTLILTVSIGWQEIFTENGQSNIYFKQPAAARPQGCGLALRRRRPPPFGRGGLGVFAFHDVPCRRFAPKFFVLKVHLFFTWRQVSRDPRRSSMGFYFIDSCAWTFRVVIIS